MFSVELHHRANLTSETRKGDKDFSVTQIMQKNTAQVLLKPWYQIPIKNLQ